MMSMRSDFLGSLQNDEPLFKARQQIEVPPLREAELREVVSRPAQLLAARFESEGLIDIITPPHRRGFGQGRGRFAAPVLHARRHVDANGASGRRDAAPSGAILRAWRRARRPCQHVSGDASGGRSCAAARSHFAVATVREDGEPTRRRAARAEFSDEEWRLVGELADYPNRLLVTATTETGETYAEVAHEAIFRRWDKLREWIAAEREFLAWRSGLEAARRAWQATADASKHDALLMGAALTQAQSWLAKRAADLPMPDREFIALSIAREKKAQARARRLRALVYVLLIFVIAGLVAWINQLYIGEQVKYVWTERPFAAANIWPYVLKPAAEQALKADPNKSFRECALKQQDKDYCPDMVVIPAGSFMMGRPATKKGYANEVPPHTVTIAKPFAVSKFQVTFDEWDTCARYGDCRQDVSDFGFGRGQRPMIEVTWDDAQQYVAWLSKMTGEPYRLLTEAEYEYASACGDDDGVSVGRRHRHEQGQLQRLRQPMGQQTNGAGGFIRPERIRSL